ncbi:MAG: beta-eliminating lyase-related protein [Pseudomonadota bacterium]
MTKFLSDNAAQVHPAVWDAMRAADIADNPYDGDALSAQLDERFSDLFGRECAALWVATGTAANCLALGTMCAPHGGVVCDLEAHIEVDEGGAPGFFLHGAKLIHVLGTGAMLAPDEIARTIDPIRDDVHQVQPHAISITQASEYGRTYSPDQLAALSAFAKERRLGLHMDGARFANSAAFLGGSAQEAARKAAGRVDSLAFGFIKNGGMNAEAVILFDVEAANHVRYRRKRAGHLQCKGRYLAAQILGMLEGDVWFANAAHANAAAQEVAKGCAGRLMHAVEANELFVRLTAAEREALRAQSFEFYDWGEDAARFVSSWNTRDEDAIALGKALASL